MRYVPVLVVASVFGCGGGNQADSDTDESEGGSTIATTQTTGSSTMATTSSGTTSESTGGSEGVAESSSSTSAADASSEATSLASSSESDSSSEVGSTESGPASSSGDSSSTGGVCADPDGDDDGHDSILCGGDDCDDTLDSVHPGAADGPWLVETIDPGAFFDGAPSIALEPDGTVHVAFWAADDGSGVGHVRVASGMPGGPWDFVDVDTEAIAEDFGAPQLAVAPGGELHVLYRSTVDGYLHATDAGGMWTIDPIDTCVGVCWPYRYDIIVVDSTVHVAWASANGLIHASGGPGAWAFETVDTAGNQPSFTASGTELHVVYWVQSEGQARHATYLDPGWATEVVADGGNSGWYPMLAVDQGGDFHVVYWAYDAFAIEHTTNEGGMWQGGTVTDVQMAEDQACAQIAIDADDRLHTLAYDGGLAQSPLVYGTRSDRGWALQNPAPYGISCRLALDQNGVPHMAYVPNLVDNFQIRLVVPDLDDTLDANCDGLPW